jgi:hypothetical protein
VAVALAFALLSLQQAVPEQRLAAPLATLPREFSMIRGIRELSDGRVVVADRLEEQLYVADLRTGAVRPIGRKGGGPQEYRLPAALIALGGDSTLLIDEGNGRLSVLGPDLRIARSIASQREGLGFGLWPRAVDRRGRLYVEVPAWAQRGGPTDSALVARWDPRTGSLDTLGRVRGPTWLTGPSSKPRIPYLVYAPQDGWAADAAGRVAFVRSARFVVEWQGDDGRVVRGAPTPHRALPVSARDRRAYVRNFLVGSSVGGRGGDGSVASGIPAAMTTDAAIDEMASRQPFAETRPPFTDAAPKIGPGSVLWVERSVASGAPRVYDLFDARGVKRRAVIFPAGRRLAGFGRAALYAVATDEDGIEQLERYAVPAM